MDYGDMIFRWLDECVIVTNEFVPIASEWGFEFRVYFLVWVIGGVYLHISLIRFDCYVMEDFEIQWFLESGSKLLSCDFDVIERNCSHVGQFTSGCFAYSYDFAAF